MSEIQSLGRFGNWVVDLLVQGYPGKSPTHGGLGWSTVALLRAPDHVVLLDTGGFGQRVPLLRRLAALGIQAGDVTDLVFSHLHWDHVANYPLFRRARIHLSREELAWAGSGAPEVYAVAEPYVATLAADRRLHSIAPGDEILPGLRALSAPGHTPHHLCCLVEGAEGDLILAQDAVKNRAELVSGDTDLTVNAAQSRATISDLRARLMRREGNVLVPGHDLPLRNTPEGLRPLGTRQASIIAHFGECLTDTTLHPLIESMP